MRMGWLVALCILSSISAAHAAKAVASGHPLLLYHAYSTNPDCTSAGPVVLRVLQAPEHGRVVIRRAGVFPRFPDSNIRSACNRRRVPGMEATYISQRGYTGYDSTVLEVLFPAGRGLRINFPIQVL